MTDPIPLLAQASDQSAALIASDPAPEGASVACPSVYPPSADAPHEGPGWLGPLRCVLSVHGHDLHMNSGINWRDSRG